MFSAHVSDSRPVTAKATPIGMQPDRFFDADGDPYAPFGSFGYIQSFRLLIVSPPGIIERRF